MFRCLKINLVVGGLLKGFLHVLKHAISSLQFLLSSILFDVLLLLLLSEMNAFVSLQILNGVNGLSQLLWGRCFHFSLWSCWLWRGSLHFNWFWWCLLSYWLGCWLSCWLCLDGLFLNYFFFNCLFHLSHGVLRSCFLSSYFHWSCNLCW